MKLALTAGGTGGHIFPAISVLEALRAEQGESLDVRFFGPDNRGEREMVRPTGIPFEAIPSAAVRGRGPIGLARSGVQLLRGVMLALRTVRSFGPDVVFSTGGYASFPASLAAKMLRRPLVVYLPDVKPGWAVRVEQRLATKLATTTEAALDYLPRKKTVVTGYPVRSDFFVQTRDAARSALGFEASDRVLLIAGASQGSQAINEVIFANLGPLLRSGPVVHITGSADYSRAERLKGELPTELAESYHIAAFRGDLPTVMLGADLAIMRAGASVIGELPAAALPSLLVPGRFAGGHQRDNAKWLEDHGAAEIVDQDNLELLAPRALALLGNTERLGQMRSAASELARPNAAADIAALLVEVARR